ncbi:hypothetical protein NSB25_17040 [Acetatifactor muris]|uniref:Bypass of forespore C C-terminal domain-containing protein n=1 Tax=Acetatifactor muris TaxID=879566 RepID=A0A2K4ZJV2_9FIRM|nr:hypothetical protein [Acetatifactor muris]MCR2048977.1 hypothetical protein [Acetatifactor muris]SOY30686.1 hypothetical protein AMURIS_03417 [Acetatifactor muris]
MKILKGISLFVLCPLLLLGLGFYAGVESSHFFNPGEQGGESSSAGEPVSEQTVPTEQEEQESGEPESMMDDSFDYGIVSEESGEEAEAEEVLLFPETLCVDTEYVLEETDILNHTVVETIWRLPDKYVGMNREQFLQAMEVYEAFPPLTEMERGFVSLEVLAFSRERVVVQMNYKFVQPSSSFYLAVYDNNVIVYLEDMKTVYIETDIRLDTLPEKLQQDIMEMMWIENEEKLYSFLENYSS